MKIFRNLLFSLGIMFGLTVVVYWFNLDTKAVKLLEKPLNKHYDNLKRDHRL